MSALILAEPPADLAGNLFGFVHRDEDPGPQVVRVLPEIRSAIQIMLDRPYWLRDAAAGAEWRRLPRMTLWGPRYEWCYGFAAGRIKAFGVGLTAAGLARVSGGAAPRLLNCALDLREAQPALAAALDPAQDESFEAWRARAAGVLRAFFTAFEPDPLAATLPILATAEGGAVAQAAAAARMSVRHYRRVFTAYYGVSPKLFQRAARVDRMLRQLHDAPWEADHYSETPIAFSDQPHATREFRSMTGLSPSEYVRSKRDGGLTLRSAPTTDVAPPTHL